MTITIWSLASVGSAPTITATRMEGPKWLLVFNTGVGVVGLLWVGYLLTDAIHEARNLAVRRSALVAGIIVIIQVLNIVRILL